MNIYGEDRLSIVSDPVRLEELHRFMCGVLLLENKTRYRSSDTVARVSFNSGFTTELAWMNTKPIRAQLLKM